VILLDLYMPEYTGLDFLRDAADLLRSTPVIVLSAAEKEAIAERCLDLGARRFLIKPVPVRVLSAEVERVLAS
jgi:DNA-binding NarL/FixJ family response regulator